MVDGSLADTRSGTAIGTAGFVTIHINASKVQMFNWFSRSSKSAQPTAATADPGRDRSGADRRLGGLPARRLAADNTSDRPSARPAGSEARSVLLAGLPPGAAGLSDDALRILAGLPAPVVPRGVCERYPQVLERLLKAWRRPADFRRTLDQILLDDRGGRQGFPFGLIAELSALREHYDLYVNPVRTTAWGSTIAR